MAGDVHYAGFWRRLAAALIDRALFVVVWGVLQLLAYGLPAPDAVMANGGGGINVSVGGLLQELVLFVVTLVLWVRLTGTPGKLLMGCHVVDAETMGPLNLRQAALRYLGYFVSALPLFAGFAWIAFDKRKQGFHDKLANTAVILNPGFELNDESAKSLDQLLKELR